MDNNQDFGCTIIVTFNIYNNTFYNTSTLMLIGAVMYYRAGGTATVNFKNNIVYPSDPGVYDYWSTI